MKAVAIEIAELLAQALIRLQVRTDPDTPTSKLPADLYSLANTGHQSDESCSHQRQPVN